MRIVDNSTLDEYARVFWNRQQTKNDPKDKEALDDINIGGDPIKWLREKYSFKLPRWHDVVIKIAELELEEVENLLIHDYMPCDQWMQDKCLVPEPYTRKLKDLAKFFICRGYFDQLARDKQQKYFCAWKEKGSLENVISSTEKPLIECIMPGTYEIVDGWGRLLPFAALLQEGYKFYPVTFFVAWEKCDSI